MKFSIKDFLSKCDPICRKLRIWSNLLKKFLMENFIFLCTVVYDAELTIPLGWRSSLDKRKEPNPLLQKKEENT